MIGNLARGIAVAAAAIGGALFVSGASGLARNDTPSVLPRAASDVALFPERNEQTAVFAGGCFWGIDAVFKHVKGVISVTSGYAGGVRQAPSYEEVSSGETGHAESVKVVYDASQISYGQLLEIFFSVHDPTQLNRQGPDVGTQYRSVVFYVNEDQKRIADAYIAQLTKARTFKKPIVTEVTKLNNFYPAEAYHQNYFAL